MSNRPFDLAKLDFEAIRKRRRKKLLLWSLAPCIIVLLFVVKFLSIPIFSVLAQQNYETLRYDAAIQNLSPLKWFNWLESYKVWFNDGNAKYKKGDYPGAEESFRTTLTTVPSEKECDVRINLALSIEQQADALLAAKKYDAAILKYDDVKAVLYDGQDSCGVRFNNRAIKSDGNEEKDGDSGEGEDKEGEESGKTDAEKIEERVQSKSDSAKRARNGDEAENKDSGSDDESSSEKLKDTQDKMDQLEKNAREAQKERSKRQQTTRQSGDYEKNDRKYTDKNW